MRRATAFPRVDLGARRNAAWRQLRDRIVAPTDDDCPLASDYVDALLEVFENIRLWLYCWQNSLFDFEDARVSIDERSEAVETLPRRFVDASLWHGPTCRLASPLSKPSVA